ncbi:MAG TPA: fibronectin type III domain-containing protein [Bacteroidia bacterium]|nr:fibronectin type III domain-containing protein [Bacteroidia bacterium]
MKKTITNLGTWGGRRNNLAVIASTAILILMILAAMTSMAQTTITPLRYWTFNGSSVGADSVGGSSMNLAAYGGTYTVGGNGQVGKYITLNSQSNLCDGGPLPLSNGFSIEFLLKPGYNFNTTNFIQRGDNAFSIKIEYPKITFYTNHRSGSGANVNDEFIVTLDGTGRKQYGYYVDGNWHHMVFKFNATTGAKEIWVDGQLPAGFSKTVTTTGTIPTSSNTNFYLNSTVSYVKYFGSIDEIAVYNTPIPPSFIYKHYLGVQNGQPYSFVDDYILPVLSPSSVTGPVDTDEFAPGHPSVTITATEQITKYPVPRYKPGHTLMRNFNWMDPRYMGGLNQPGVTQQMAADNGVIIQTELARNFNYYFNVEFGTSTFATAWVNAANSNPDLKLAIITLRAQLNGNNPQITSQSLASSNYLQDANGQFMDVNGNATTNKIWRPTAPTSNYNADGNTVLGYFNDLFTRLNGNIDFVNENGEIFPHPEDIALSKDPVVTTAKNASGMDWKEFLASKFKDNETQSFRNIFMAHPKLANAKFTEYSIDGFPQYRFAYSQARLVNSQMNGQYYATPDFYPRWPNNWRNWMAAWHGWQWIVDSRVNELAVGDKLYSPFVSAGWDANEEQNIRPAQWLGLLKCLNMTGAEFFYAGFFSLSAPWPDSKNWIWQSVMPAYAQGIASRYEDLLRNGNLMPGDVGNYYINPTAPGYAFWAGDQRKLVVVRKHNTLAKYAITGTVQPNSNMVGNVENESVATITLDGQTLKFNVRRQGSTYIYDNTNASQPVFYQLDGWHERKHPSKWSPDFNFEAELFDNTNTQVTIKTTVPAGTAAGDYTNFTSYLAWPDNATSITPVEYNFQPRSGQNNELYLWVRARSRGGISTGMNVQVDNNTAYTIGCISDTNWTWYRYDACSQLPINFQGLQLQNHLLRITPTTPKLEIDQVLLSTDASLILNPALPSCGTASASITANGPTTFCQGSTVVLTASSGSTYLWSPGGQTTQSISVNTSGSYAVNVGAGAGCAAIASPVTVTVNPTPSTAITAGGPTTFCQGGSVSLQANAAGNTYLWSPGGQTSQAVSITSTGTYTVKVTSTQGCSATSAPVQVIVNSTPVATISANGPTTFCSGSSVTLTSSSGASYLWFPNGQTTSSITTGTAGSYSVRVTSAGGCTAMSSPLAITVNAATPATITPNGSTTFCTGSGVDLTANAGVGYLWNNGETTQTISALSTGQFQVTVDYGSGCSSTSATIQTTVVPQPVATISVNGNTTLQQGQTTTLTASGGSSYVWSPGGETTASITVNTGGSYAVTAFNGAGCSATSAPVIITVTSTTIPAVITASGPTGICEGESVTLTANSGSAYLWSPGGETTQSISASATGNYTVEVTDATGFNISQASKYVTVYPVPQPPGISMSYIPSSTYQLSAYEPTAHSYLWSNGATSQSITVSTTGTYTVTAINGMGCVSTVQSMVVSNVAPQPCAKPNMLSNYNITDSLATIAWNPAITADSFRVVYTQIGTSFSMQFTVPGNANTFDLSNLLPGTTYKWYTTAYCGTGQQVSSQKQFTTLSGPMPCGSTPQQCETYAINSNFAKLRWYETESDKFVIRYRPVGTTTYLYRRSFNTLDDGIIQNLIPNTAYEWSVRSMCGNNVSLYSDPVYFTTLPVCPSVGPVTIIDVGHDKALLAWNGAIDVDTVRIRFAVHGTTDYHIRKISGTPNPGAKWITGLEPETMYDVWVSSLCSSGSISLWGTPVTFTTLAAPVPRLTPEAGILHLNGFPNPAQYQIGYVFESDKASDYTIKICDIMGRQLISEVRSTDGGLHADKITLAGIPNGLYMMVVEQGPMVGRFKFNISK